MNEEEERRKEFFSAENSVLQGCKKLTSCCPFDYLLAVRPPAPQACACCRAVPRAWVPSLEELIPPRNEMKRKRGDFFCRKFRATGVIIKNHSLTADRGSGSGTNATSDPSPWLC